MTSKYIFPALDTDGWTKTTIKVADYLFSHFFLAEYSQTFAFSKNVSSFPWILQHHQSNLEEAIATTQQTLSAYFSKYFDEVECQVAEVPNAESINNHQLSIFLSFVDQTKTKHNLERLIKYQGLKVNEIIAVNNGV